MAFDAAAMCVRPTATTDGLWISGLMGLGLGAIGAAAVSPNWIAALEVGNIALRNYLMRESLVAQRSELLDWEQSLVAGRANFMAQLEKRVKDGMRVRSGDYTYINRAIERARNADPEAQVAERILGRINDETPTFHRAGVQDHTGGRKDGEMTAKTMLDDLKTAADPLVAGLAGRLAMQLGDDLPVNIRDGLNRSHYLPGEHVINLCKDADDWVKLHELVHAATANKLRYGAANPRAPRVKSRLNSMAS